MDTHKNWEITWGLLKIFGPLVLALLILGSPPVTRLYARYIRWVNAKFEPMRQKQIAETEALKRKMVEEMIAHQFAILDVWYNHWMENSPGTPCPLSWLRRASSFACLQRRVEGDVVVFHYHDSNVAERRWPLSTIDMEK